MNPLRWLPQRFTKALTAAMDSCGPSVIARVVQRCSKPRRPRSSSSPGLVAPGLFAAGDYVEGPYPATLEGAVRSGRAASRAVMPVRT